MSMSLVSTPSPIAVLDENGYIMSVNRAWEAFGEQNGLPEDYTAEGENYVLISQQADDTYGKHVVAELRRLLTGRQTEFTVVYPCHSPKQERWFRLYATAVSLNNEHYYLVIHQQISHDTASGDRWEPTVVTASTGSVDQWGQGRLVTYTLSSDESATEGLLMAFDAIGIDTQRRDTTLQDWIDPDTINTLQSRTTDFHLTFRIWGHTVGLTPRQVIIYSPERSSE
ncbi:PAS domain-containing protein [Halorubrum sp. AD140]|uniref:PAS domain-containing protein n=1 Tax=Halorubrum sp. AD140 TaxID=3050073 RepID=UPI00350E5840